MSELLALFRSDGRGSDGRGSLARPLVCLDRWLHRAPAADEERLD